LLVAVAVVPAATPLFMKQVEVAVPEDLEQEQVYP
jgi:hypothetical protein